MNRITFADPYRFFTDHLFHPAIELNVTAYLDSRIIGKVWKKNQETLSSYAEIMKTLVQGNFNLAAVNLHAIENTAKDRRDHDKEQTRLTKMRDVQMEKLSINFLRSMFRQFTLVRGWFLPAKVLS